MSRASIKRYPAPCLPPRALPESFKQRTPPFDIHAQLAHARTFPTAPATLSLSLSRSLSLSLMPSTSATSHATLCRQASPPLHLHLHLHLLLPHSRTRTRTRDRILARPNTRAHATAHPPAPSLYSLCYFYQGSVD